MLSSASVLSVTLIQLSLPCCQPLLQYRKRDRYGLVVFRFGKKFFAQKFFGVFAISFHYVSFRMITKFVGCFLRIMVFVDAVGKLRKLENWRDGNWEDWEG
jgi:hypothetical protein